MGVRLPPEYQEVEWIGSNNDAYLVIKNAVGLPEVTNLKVKTTVLWKYVLSRQIHGRNGRCYFGVADGYYQNTQTGTGHTQIKAVANEWASVEWSRNNSVCTLKVGNDIDITNSTIAATDPMPFALFALGDGSIRCYCALKETHVEIGSEQFDLIPCYRKQDSKPGMYDLASDTFFVNKGSREFDIGPDVIDSISPWLVARRRLLMQKKMARLPAEYQEVEYLEMSQTGTPYINSGVAITEDLVFEIDFQPLDVVRARYFMGTYNGTDFYLYVGYKSQAGAEVLYFQTAFGATWQNTTLLADTQRHKFTYQFENGNLVVKDSDTTILTKAKGIFSERPILVAGTSQGIRTPCRTYESKMTKSGVVIQDLIPCYRKADDTPGMYDLVSNTFFTNAGTGEFIVGADIN